MSNYPFKIVLFNLLFHVCIPVHTSSKVEIPGLDVLSYAGYITVDEEYDRNLFFWFFPSTEVCFLVFIWYGIERYFSVDRITCHQIRISVGYSIMILE